MKPIIKTLRIKLDKRDPDLARIREIARGCREGKLVAFPTETVYGVGGPMSVHGLADKLRGLKRRSEDKPFSFHIGEWEMVDYLGVERTPAFRYISRLCWPGPLTLLVNDRDGEKIGLRYPSHRLACALINATGEPFIATSANVSGKPSPKTPDQVMEQLGGEIDYLIDSGPCDLGEESSVLDLTGKEPRVLRRGAQIHFVEEVIEKVKYDRFPHKKILFVCTGNSCRSPMASGWLKDQLKARNLGDKIEVASCGVGARGGAMATPEAILVMKNREIDISEHRARPISREDIVDSDLIFAMSRDHYTFIVGMLPSAKDKVRMLEVPDPIGLSLTVYEDVMTLIEKKLKEHWTDIIK